MAEKSISAAVASLVLVASFVYLPGSPAHAIDLDTEIVIVGGSGVVSEGMAEHLVSCSNQTVERHAGKDRFGTAAAIAAEWETSVETVFLATGVDFPDAVAAGPVASLSSAPILLTYPDRIPAVTNQALARLAPNRVVLLGGPGAISAEVEADLRARFPEVFRIGGIDRYATAAALSAWYFEAGTEVAYLATGTDYPDALVAGPRAIGDEAPLLLVKEHDVPSPTRQELLRLAPLRIVLVGSGRIDESVISELAGYASAGIEQITGGSRYETAVAAAAGASGSRVFIVTGEDFADGLAATPLAGPSPILFVTANSLSSATATAVGERTGVSCEPWSVPYPEVGLGKRIIYSNSAQRVWLIDENELLVDTYLVSGRAGVPSPGTYSVYSKSTFAWASYGGITMNHMVRFVPPYMLGNRLAYGFHSIPRYADGTPMQSEDELGTFLSGGCVRQADHKARALFDWAPIGTTVVVLP